MYSVSIAGQTSSAMAARLVNGTAATVLATLPPGGQHVAPALASVWSANGGPRQSYLLRVLDRGRLRHLSHSHGPVLLQGGQGAFEGLDYGEATAPAHGGRRAVNDAVDKVPVLDGERLSEGNVW